MCHPPGWKIVIHGSKGSLLPLTISLVAWVADIRQASISNKESADDLVQDFRCLDFHSGMAVTRTPRLADWSIVLESLNSDSWETELLLRVCQ